MSDLKQEFGHSARTSYSLSLSLIHQSLHMLHWFSILQPTRIRRRKTMGGFGTIGSAFDSKSGQIIMASLLLMIVSFYVGTLFGNNTPLYISHLPSPSSNNNTTLSSNGNYPISYLFPLISIKHRHI